jgi:hypothetical protein
MLVQFTQVSALPADVKSRLMSYLKAAPLLMGQDPILFEGYHLSPAELQGIQVTAKANSSTQILLG